MKVFHKLYHPEVFQGNLKKKHYFEGWYFKFVSADESRAFAVIPGIAIEQATNAQSFIQFLDGKKREANYYKFDLASFQPKEDSFEVTIDQNHFSANRLHLDLENVKGDLKFTNNIPWPVRWYSPGIMGPFAFMPFLECYHGIVSMDHQVFGTLEIKGEKINFDGGRGYIEKDWGRSFPSAYVWMQSNHFEIPGVSVKASVAKIPWLGSSFVGFIAGVWLENRLIQFTTYNRSNLRLLNIDQKKLELVLENSNYKLEIFVARSESTPLASPIQGLMDGRIEESMTSVLEVTLTEKKGNAKILVGKGRNTGLEVAGNISEIITT